MSVAEITPRGEEFERTPPHDLAAEQCVLGGMMLSKDAISDVLEIIRPQDHYRPAHQIVHEVILDLYGRGEPADAVTVAAELTKRGDIGRMGGAPYLHTLIASVPTAANAGYYARIVRERALLRRLVEVGTRIVQLGYSGDGDADDLVDRAEAEVYGVTERRVSDDYLPLSEIMPGALDEIEAIGSRGGALTGVPTGFADLDSLTNGLHPGQMIVIAARPALGKALALDTQLPTPGGWTTMGEVQVGDQLIGADGRPVNVVAATEVMHERPCYEVEFCTGEVIVADGQHEWLTWDRDTSQAYDDQRSPGAPAYPEDWPTWEATCSARRPCRPAVREAARDPRAAGHPQAAGSLLALAAPHAVAAGHAVRVSPRTTAELAATLRARGQSNHAIPAARPLVLPTADLPVEPYRLGCLLGGGDHGGSRRARQPWRWLGRRAGQPIPSSYLRGSFVQRLALAQGLVDSGGYVDRQGAYRFATSDRRLVDGFSQLVASLGCVASVYPRRGRLRAGRFSRQSWEARVRTDLPLSRLPRKALKARRDWGREQAGRYIVDVRAVPSRPVRCVQVDSSDHLYLASRGMIPTRNSTLALDLARAASVRHGLTSVIFSLEMSRNEITMRLLSAEARVPLHSMRTGQMGDEDWTRLARRMSEVVNAPLFIDDSPNMSMMEIRAKCRRLKQRNDLRLVIIDYLQLMSSPKRVENRQQEVSDMSRSLKLLAKELNVPVIAVAQLNRGPEQRTDKRPLLADLRESGCLTAGTRIMRADTGSEVSLGDLIASGESDIPVWSLDERLRMVPRTMTHAFSSGVREVFQVRLQSGREVEATANHPFLTYDGWRGLGELSAGSRVAVPRHVPAPLNNRPWPEHEIITLARLAGGGSSIRDDSPGLSGLGNHEKFVLAPVFAFPQRQLALFLHHLWAADGSVSVGNSGAVRVHYATTSEQLARGLQILMLRFGIMTCLRSAGNNYGHPQWTLDVADVEDQRRFLAEIGVPGQPGQAVTHALDRLRLMTAAGGFDTIPARVWERVRQVMDERDAAIPKTQVSAGTRSRGEHSALVRPAGKPLRRIAEALGDAELEMLSTNDVYWDEIKSIQSLGAQPVYDATVLGTHNFLANGINVHNSIEQDSDVVILLHREDAYERESPRAGEADFIVAKHRNGPTATVTVAFQGHFSRFVDMAPT